MNSEDLDLATIPRALEGAARAGGGGLEIRLEEGPVRLSLLELASATGDGARALLSWGVRPGDRVGVLGPNHPDWAVSAFSVWEAGAALVPLSFPLRIRDPDAFKEHVSSLVRAAGCRMVLAHSTFVPYVDQGLVREWTLPRGGAEGRGYVGPRPEDVAVIQFTSGSTSSPKGAVITHRSVLSSVRITAAGLGMDEHDRQVGWLPFFHDWGLFGNLVRPLLRSCPAVLLPTERFAAAPGRWFRLIGEVGGTITEGPSSAWDVALRSAMKNPEGIDLSTLRRGVLAAEAIDPDVVDRLIEEGARWGLRPEALSGGYGLAEATLGLAVSRRGDALRIDVVDKAELAGRGRAVPAEKGRPSKRVPSCGEVMPEVRMRIVGEQGPLPDRQVGELQVKAPSLMEGYLGGDDQDPFEDGWLQTGDLAYLAEGELFITGRKKDTIIVMGSNYAPEDLEWAAERLPDVRSGRCVAFRGADGLDGVVIMAVEPTRGADPAIMPGRVRRAVADAVGVAPQDVLVLPKGSIPKTTSGKLRRGALREAYLRGELAPLIPSALGSPDGLGAG